MIHVAVSQRNNIPFVGTARDLLYKALNALATAMIVLNKIMVVYR
ncbi:MAG: hypothetical protein ACD_75C01129G0002 [uncultured bacterium]|nr:MAG: hypothetical protein ACD_75C01129G0002 [uncultured bacterium]